MVKNKFDQLLLVYNEKLISLKQYFELMEKTINKYILYHIIALEQSKSH